MHGGAVGTLGAGAFALAAYALLAGGAGDGSPAISLSRVAPVEEAVPLLPADATPAPALAGRPTGPAWPTGVPGSLSALAKPAKLNAVAGLARARGWVECLRAATALPENPGQRLTELLAALGAAEGEPVVRQNLVFLGLLLLPPEEAAAWLAEVRRIGDAADREDALVALAFGGDPTARAEFAALAATPSAADVHRLLEDVEDHEALGKLGDAAVRESLRAWRAIEALDRAPYFKRTILWIRTVWTPAPPLDAGARQELLEAWLSRWPAHPGSDDVALRIADLRAEAGDWVEAACWACRASTMPDQDVACASVRRLLSIAELRLTPAEIARVADDRDVAGRNRGLLRYVRLRRIAVEDGPEAALAEAAAVARGEPGSRIAAAWRDRGSVFPPRGLRSGMAPLPWDDALGAVGVAGPAPDDHDEASRRRLPTTFYGGPWGLTGQSGEGRLEPWPEAVVLDVRTLARQLRTWETLAELERRAARARGEERADLLYKAGAVLYHDPNAYFPVYGFHTESFAIALRSTCGKGDEPLAARFAQLASSSRRAVETWRRIERDHPGYGRMDRVLYSQGLAWRRRLDDRADPEWDWRKTWDPVGEDDRDGIRRLVEAFERCAREFPDGDLAAGARAAAAWWRNARPRAFAR